MLGGHFGPKKKNLPTPRQFTADTLPAPRPPDPSSSGTPPPLLPWDFNKTEPEKEKYLKHPPRMLVIDARLAQTRANSSLRAKDVPCSVHHQEAQESWHEGRSAHLSSGFMSVAPLHPARLPTNQW